MSTYNTTNFYNTINGYSSTQWRTFGSDVASNIQTAFTSRWTLTSRQQTSLLCTNQDDRDYFNLKCNQIADQLDNGGTIDFSGTTVSDTGTSSHPNSQWILHLDFQWVGASYVITSAWIEHKLTS